MAKPKGQQSAKSGPDSIVLNMKILDSLAALLGLGIPPDADKLLQAIEPVFTETSFMKGAEVKKCYGPAGTGAKEVILHIKTR